MCRKVWNIIEYLPSWINIDYFDNEKSFEYLSSGEKSLFRIILDLVYQIEKVKLHYDSINILLDETELGLHPQWQKEYFKNILKSISVFSDKNFNINLIFVTHSPFLLSDIPKENIIFLDKKKNGDCKVLSHNEVLSKKQTFGANIHTLLSDSFFMEDGLMGEFAKSKIDDVINYLHDRESKIKSDDEAQKLIHIIGEPIVKNRLQRMLDSRRLSNIDIVNQKIKEMSYELEILKQYQSKIVQDELRDKGKKQYKQRFKDD